MRISALLTAYNAAWCIERALDSVLAQSRPPDEVIVTDDGSTDGTPELIEARYAARVRVVRLPHGGLTRSRKAAFELASGDWLAMLDADDRWEPRKVERQEECARSHPDVRWIGTDAVYVSAEGVLRPSWLSDYFAPVRTMVGDLLVPLVERSFVLPSTAMIEREAYRAVGGFDVSYVYSQDYDLFLRLAARYPGAVLAEPLVQYWSSPGQISRRLEERHRDNLRLMEGVASGALRPDPRLRAAGRRRVADLCYMIASFSQRRGEAKDARRLYLRALGGGATPMRRVSAAARLLVPAGVLRAVARFTGLGGRTWPAAVRMPPAGDASSPATGESDTASMSESSLGADR